MNGLISLAFQVALIHALHLSMCCCEGTSITLSPLGVVSVCPGGQIHLICERTSGSFLHWDIAVPHMTTPETIVAIQGGFSPIDLQLTGLHYTTFTITRRSVNPLTSQMIVNNVTTEVNGSTIYCSEDGNENGAPMVTIAVTNEAHPLNVLLVNHFSKNSIIVTLEWPHEAGAVYSIDILSETSHTELTNYNSTTLNMTISYDIQYNVSISSSLCDATTTRVLKYVSCDLPAILLHRHVTVVNVPQDHPLLEGQFITYTCPPGLVLTGPSASVCTGNREWEPDPGELDCIVPLATSVATNCGEPVVNSNVKLNHNSTLEGSVLMLTCENDISSMHMNTTDEQFLNVTCHSNGNWIPDPAEFACLSFTTVPSGFANKTSGNTLLFIVILVILSGIISIIMLIGLPVIFCMIRRKCVAKKTSEKDQRTQQPTYEEVPCRIGIVMEGNAAYGHVIQANKNYHPEH